MRNADLAYRTLDYIDAHPEEWEQSEWACGTKACFAGWAVILSGGKIDDVNFDAVVRKSERGSAAEPYEGWTVDDAAQGLLGVADINAGAGQTNQELDWLFAGTHNRDTLGRCVERMFGPRPTDMKDQVR